MYVAIPVWLVCTVLAAMIGQRKGEGGLALLLGLFLGPIGLLLVIFSAGKRIKCPHCRESIDPEASVCPHCRREAQSLIEIQCPKCQEVGTVVAAMLGKPVTCPKCTKDFRAKAKVGA